jgi:CMP-N-acetylneuraminic acid synthetase
MIVALIPARGGSKRVPRKNLKPFAGRPLLYYSIVLAQAVKAIDRCLVSTEDGEIAEVAEAFGAEVLKRPVELSDDYATTASVVRHALEELVRRGEEPEALVLLQPNCPLRTVSMVQEALGLFAGADVDSVMTVTRNTHKLGEISDGLFRLHYRAGIRSQDMAPTYFENGLVYVVRPQQVLETGQLFGERILPLITDPLYARGDIDDALDFEVAEFLYQKYRDHLDYVVEG